jgi:hypothetical protein
MALHEPYDSLPTAASGSQMGWVRAAVPIAGTARIGHRANPRSRGPAQRGRESLQREPFGMVEGAVFVFHHDAIHR